MSPDELTYGLRQLIVQFPFGTVVWHRANAKRGVVTGWSLDGDGSTVVRVDYGGTYGTDYAVTLSKQPVPEGGDGEQWKEGAETP